MKHDGNQILIELTILFILVLIISLMFFVIKKKFCRKNFFVVLYIVILANHCRVGFPEIGNNIFQRYLNVREPNTNKKKYPSFGGIWSKSDNVYILIDSQYAYIYASTTVTVKNLPAGLKKFQWKTWELQYVHSLQMFQVKELQFMEHKSLHQFWTTCTKNIHHNLPHHDT